MRTETVTRELFKFSELTDDAKETARQWYRDSNADDPYWSENVTEDAKDVLTALGYSLGCSNPNIRPQPSGIYWSGFWSQGDGACFEGNWRASDFDAAKAAALLADRPTDAALHSCIDALTGIVKEHPELTASLTHRGHYYHDGCVDIDTDTDCDAFAEVSRDLMRWIYRVLESEWEYQNSDACIDENIEANDYEFTENGRLA